MRNKHLTTSLGHCTHEVPDNVIAIVIIDAQSMFDGHRNIDGIIHCSNAVPHKLRLTHQARTEGTVLNTV